MIQIMSILDATRRGDIEKAQELLRNDVEIEINNGHGWTPLHIAVVYERIDFVKELLKHGSNIHAKTNNGDTPLHVASLHGHTDIVRYLLKNGAVIATKNIKGETPFKMGYRKNKEKIREIVRNHISLLKK